MFLFTENEQLTAIPFKSIKW